MLSHLKTVTIRVLYTYPNRILAHFDVDQFEVMKKRMLHAIGSNRAVAVTYDPKLDQDREDIPCLQFLQCIVRNNELTIHCLFRSTTSLELSIQICFIAYIGIKMKRKKSLIKSYWAKSKLRRNPLPLHQRPYLQQ